MDDKETKILKTFNKLIPKLNDDEKKQFLSFAKGMVAMKSMQEKKSKVANK